jgi:hypothetical protein
MARHLSLPKSFENADKNFIRSLITATEEVFKGDLFGETNRSLSESYTSVDGYYWPTNKDLLIYVTDLTGTTDIKSANSVLYKKLSTAPEAVEFKGAEKTSPNANTINKEILEGMVDVNEENKAKLKADTEKSNQEVRDAIKRKQEIYAQEIQKAKILEEALKNKKIYYKVEEAKTELREQAEAKPKKFVEDTATRFKNSPNLKNLSPDEAKIESEQASVTTYDALTNNPKSPIFQAAIAERIVSDPKLLNKYVPDLENQKILKDISSVLTEQKIAQFEIAKQFVRLPENINFEFSNVPKQGFKEYDLSQISSQYSDSLGQQSFLLNSLGSLGEREIRSRILLSVGNKLTSYISTLPADSLLAHTYNSEIVQLGLDRIGVVESASLVSGSWAGNTLIATGLGDVGLFVQAKTGIDLGIKVATKEAGKQVVEKGLEVAGKVAVEGGVDIAGKSTVGVGLIAVLTPFFAWAGPLAPILAGITSFVATSVIGKGVSDAFSKIKVFIKRNDLSAAIPALLGAGIAIPFLGVGAGLGIGGGIFGGLKLAGSTSAGRAAFGRGVGNFFGAVAGATLGAIGGPILGILIGFPVIVALILFIINSGAYIVPPSPLSLSSGATITSPYIEVSKIATPTGPFQNSELPLTVEYQITIKAKKGTLSNVSISYDCNVIKKSGSIKCPETMPAMPDGIKIPNSSISPTSSFEFSYKQTYGANFQDTLITDSLTVTADTPEQPGVSAAASAGVKIGNPPDVCPSGWPIAGVWGITQTPGGSYSHSAVEAIDFKTPIGTPVRATHSGIANVVRTTNAYAPVYVTITSNCGGNTFTSWYAHLSLVSVTSGQQVIMGQNIGATGNGGSGPHLHYEFRGIRMDIPYIPKSVQRQCSNDSGSCGSIP